MSTSDPAQVVPFPNSAPAAPDRGVAKRWGHESLFEKGFVMTPTFFLRAYTQLTPFSLTHGEAMFVIHLMQYKWDDDAPFPSYATVAKQMGVSAKQVQRYASGLETKKYLRRQTRKGMSNRFDLVPLFDALEALRVSQGRKAGA